MSATNNDDIKIFRVIHVEQNSIEENLWAHSINLKISISRYRGRIRTANAVQLNNFRIANRLISLLETFARQRYSAPIFNLKRFLMLKTPKNTL